METSLQLIDLLFNLIDLWPFPLHAQLLLLFVGLRNFLPQLILLILSFLKELIIFQVPVAIHRREFSDELPSPKLVILDNFIGLVHTLNDSGITTPHNGLKVSFIRLWLRLLLLATISAFIGVFVVLSGRV